MSNSNKLVFSKVIDGLKFLFFIAYNDKEGFIFTVSAENFDTLIEKNLIDLTSSKYYGIYSGSNNDEVWFQKDLSGNVVNLLDYHHEKSKLEVIKFSPKRLILSKSIEDLNIFFFLNYDEEKGIVMTTKVRNFQSLFENGCIETIIDPKYGGVYRHKTLGDLYFKKDHCCCIDNILDNKNGKILLEK